MTIINIIAKILIETYDKIMGDFLLKDTSVISFLMENVDFLMYK